MKYSGKQLKSRLVELRNAIKRKYQMFKDGVEENEVMLEKQYKPLIRELRKNNASDPMNIKTEQMSVKKEEEPMDYETDESSDTTPLAERQFEPSVASTPQAASTSQSGHAVAQAEISDIVSTDEDLASTTQYIDEYFKNPVTKEYMTLFFKDAKAKKQVIDQTFGPRYDTATLMIGNKTLDFDDEGNIIIGGTNYGQSEGLYELIFKRVPNISLVGVQDYQTYKSILKDTNAHREGYKSNGRIRAANSTKYSKIIKKLLTSPSKGKGLQWKKTKSPDIIHWDDPNELVERLRHIAMSTESGNRVHGNEILSIIEELREAGYLKGAGNSRFKALL